MGTLTRRLIVVTGLSGGGKTVVLNALEDLGYYCIDNLPIGLLPEFIRQSRENDQTLYRRVAIGIDARNPADALSRFPDHLRNLGSGNFTAELLFVEANDETLIKRFSETRRKHPLSSDGVSLSDAIGRERQLLGTLSERADLRIDTSHTYVHQLRDFVRERVARRAVGTLSLQFVSFGFKHGIPPDADFVFDVRCLPNPYWDAQLRDHSGRDPGVIEFLGRAPVVGEMVADIGVFLDAWVPRFVAENRSYLTVAVGCTGGHHRSVYVVDRLAARFGVPGRKTVAVTHRDI